jgi:hypothetical protein
MCNLELRLLYRLSERAYAASADVKSVTTRLFHHRHKSSAHFLVQSCLLPAGDLYVHCLYLEINFTMVWLTSCCSWHFTSSPSYLLIFCISIKGVDV